MARSYVATPVVVLGVSNLDSYQSGQWIKIAGNKRAARLVRERNTGRVYVVAAPSHSRLSTAAFRLTCGTPKPSVVREVK